MVSGSTASVGWRGDRATMMRDAIVSEADMDMTARLNVAFLVQKIRMSLSTVTKERQEGEG